MSRLIGVRCPTCLGTKPKGNFQVCVVCQDRGYILKPLDQLTEKQRSILRRELAESAPDSETLYETQSVRENLTKLLTGIKVRSIEFPAENNHTFTLHTYNLSISIYPEYKDGKLSGLNAIPQPPPLSTDS